MILQKFHYQFRIRIYQSQLTFINNNNIMELINPKCIGGKNCFLVCNTPDCSRIPFMCTDKCQCELLHKECKSTIKWNNLREILMKKIKEAPWEIKNYLNQVDEIYKSIFKEIERSYAVMKSLQYTFRLSPIQRQVFVSLQQNRLNQLNGRLISKIQVKPERLHTTLINDKIEQTIKKIHQHTKILIKMLEDLTEEKQSKTQQIDSNLIKDTQVISKLFTKKVKQMKLVYRASENNFQVTKFHEKCDGIPHTLIILKTQFGKVIGGYTPLMWNKNLHGKSTKDESKQSFIFSMTQKHKLPLINGRQLNAIYHQSNRGPIFGGSDLCICDKAHQNANSYANVGHTYNNCDYTYNNQQSSKKFSGQANGWNYKIQEWQVFEIIFE